VNKVRKGILAPLAAELPEHRGRKENAGRKASAVLTEPLARKGLKELKGRKANAVPMEPLAHKGHKVRRDLAEYLPTYLKAFKAARMTFTHQLELISRFGQVFRHLAQLLAMRFLQIINFMGL
jgi:hypothetical protein